ncbi:MAG: DMT family transporter [Lachnospiraceae bacterium]
MVGFLIAVVSGALMSVQGMFNTGVTKVSGVWATSVFVQISAFVVCLGAWAMLERGNLLKVFCVEPKYMLLSGAIGAFITFTVVKSIELVGPAKAALFIVVSQITISYLIEVLGLFGAEKAAFSWRKILGLGIVYVGVFLFKWEK